MHHMLVFQGAHCIVAIVCGGAARLMRERSKAGKYLQLFMLVATNLSRVSIIASCFHNLQNTMSKGSDVILLHSRCTLLVGGS